MTTVRHTGIKAGWEQWIMLFSDQHFDSISCNRELLTEHLEEAKRRRAWVISVGDWFDAMQGRFDPRRSMDALRPEYRREDYYDFVVEDSSRYLEKYARQFVVFADGNHELSVLKNANTNLADRLVANLRKGGGRLVHGGFGGWVLLLLNGGEDGPRYSIRIKYFHGAGSDAPVTRGVIQTNRQAVYLPDADVVVNGHNHSAYVVPIARERLTIQGQQYADLAYHVRTPGYKQEYGDGATGWDVSRGAPPKPIGCIWLKLSYKGGNGEGKNHNGRIVITPIPDVRGPDMTPLAAEGYEGRVYPEDVG